MILSIFGEYENDPRVKSETTQYSKNHEMDWLLLCFLQIHYSQMLGQASLSNPGR